MSQPLSHIILISDMDDTLLTKDKKISPENHKAIQKFRSLGGRFTIATGRSIPSYRCYRDQIQADLPVILNNGAMVYDPEKEEILWNTHLPEQAKQYIADTLKVFPHMGVEVLLGEEIYIINNNKRVEEHMGFEQLKHTNAALDQIPEEWYKVLYAADDPADILKLRDYLTALGHAGVHYVNSSQCYYEMLPKDSSKGAAMRKMLEMERLDDKVVCAVGDFYNDIEMMKYADIGFAVANAPDDVKAHADRVCLSSEEHAIADIIEYIINSGI